MQLQYINRINAFGENIMRLYDFDNTEARKFQELLKQDIIKEKKELDLNIVPFIQPRNCSLVLRIADEDIGIHTQNNFFFFCDLTIQTYQEIVVLIEPFCHKNRKSYQWLYDIDTLTSFLFSPAGSDLLK
ncbi:MAG: hypothetical protein ACPG5B_01865 [Chitinophagales bacterium]